MQRTIGKRFVGWAAVGLAATIASALASHAIAARATATSPAQTLSQAVKPPSMTTFTTQELRLPPTAVTVLQRTR